MYLEEVKSGHSKVKENKYSSFQKPQPYLTSKLISNKQCALMFALKSKTVWGIRDSFLSVKEVSIHIIQCQVLQDIIPLTNEVNFSDIGGSLEQQKAFIDI